ncbi:MAG: sensor histidine kinase [Cyclobacteriaceae bacterium]|jgi:signal transduction histidine kinase
MIWTLVIGVLLLAAVAFFLGGYRITRKYRNREGELQKELARMTLMQQRSQEELAELHEQLQYEILRNGSLLQHEQKRIAGELHDDTVQRIVAVRFKLEEILYSNSPVYIEKQVEALRSELDDIIGTVRYLIKGLTQPKFEKFSFAHISRELICSLGVMHHLKVNYQVVNEPLEFAMPASVKQDLYYIMHEVCHNFLKSSMGFQLTCTLSWSRELLRINMEDNGQGMATSRGYGLGMQSMQERADRIGAQIDFITITVGLHVVIRLPNRFSN